ncbi:MAG: extracellular solute-binding protein [Chloroflexi bacterium]|nr:extracellular solute-binding protein [Chloroflexota bacterium]
MKPKKVMLLAVVALLLALFSTAALAQDVVELTMGSWRVDDVAQMQVILDAFTAEHPNIKITFDPTNPPDYNATLRTQLEGGTAPDLFYLRSYATSRQLFEEGYLEPLSDLPGLMENFTPEARAPWSTEDGVPYGVPFIAVSHGVYYNVDLFNELGIEIPTTWEELIAAAQQIKDAGYVPFANASGDEWTIAEIVFMNLAPNFIGGYEGRQAYLNGERCFNDPNAVAAFQAVADLAPFLPEGQEALTYYDSQQLFLMGEAAMWLGGSWDIPFFESEEPDFEWSVFAVPAKEGQEMQYVTFHMDAGMGLNSASEHKEEAKVFLEWMTTPEFAKLMADNLPGFFPISKEPVTLANEHANTFLALNDGRGLDVRWAWEGLLDGQPDGYTLMQNGALAVIAGEQTPQEAADALQEGLAQWFEPAQNCAQ